MKQKILSSLFLIISYQMQATIPKTYIASFLPENPVIVEAGAFKGEDTAEMSKVWPQAMIYAFEPVPVIFESLVINTQQCQNVIRIEKALSDKKGFDVMHISQGGEASSSLLAPEQTLYYHFPQITFPSTITVETITLDDFAQEMNIDHIDFLWLDLQGVELKVLRASPIILKTVKVIHTEVNYTDLYCGISQYPEYKEWLEAEGFVLVKEVVSHPTWGDALFVRR